MVGTVGAHNFNIMTGNTFRVNIDGDNLGGMGIGMDAKGDEKLVVAGDTGITGSLHVSGNISTSGSIIAKEFRTEFVNQIIATSSGSTEFGDDTGDTHRFTGSLELSGSILRIVDNNVIQVGTGGDLRLTHQSGNSFIHNNEPNLFQNKI